MTRKMKKTNIIMKPHRLINARLSEVLDLFRRCRTFAINTIHAPDLFHLRRDARTKGPAHNVSVYLTRHRMRNPLRELETYPAMYIHSPNKVQVWSTEIALGGSYVRPQSFSGPRRTQFLVLSWSKIPLKETGDVRSYDCKLTRFLAKIKWNEIFVKRSRIWWNIDLSNRWIIISSLLYKCNTYIKQTSNILITISF